ncbi:uncharacterized protein GIQ15_03601 [Arthroderma uncinatum]|uniref:uncharacterized protein n=1 Tax=Arthroderma uncinatum TaxID=74035 RepID=UPI00144AE0D7|nr:uncharacterized protein GIQ15_03601 [Arthroderma uncinatum]KAF3484277.1 hypothetical protein GIQ15_03601 [Arthroderma uncinatum]
MPRMIPTILDDVRVFPTESIFAWHRQFPSAQNISNDELRDDITKLEPISPYSLPLVSGVEYSASETTMDIEANATSIVEPGDAADLPIELTDDDDCPNEPGETSGYANSESKRSPSPISVERDGEISHEWEVEAILALKKKKKEAGWFKVKFKGREEAEWLPEEDVYPGCEELINEFLSQTRRRSSKKRHREPSVERGRKRQRK